LYKIGFFGKNRASFTPVIQVKTRYILLFLEINLEMGLTQYFAKWLLYSFSSKILFLLYTQSHKYETFIDNLYQKQSKYTLKQG